MDIITSILFFKYEIEVINNPKNDRCKLFPTSFILIKEIGFNLMSHCSLLALNYAFYLYSL